MPRRRPHPNCYVIAGSNGAGKTTFATEFLPHYANCPNFINPDLIARGLSPFDPDAALARAWRLTTKRAIQSAFALATARRLGNQADPQAVYPR